MTDQMINPVLTTEASQNMSLYNPNYTYSYSKYSCIREFYFAHVVFNYFIFLSGIGAFVTRLLPPKFKWIHVWFGRIYILSMLWSTVTSLLINNTGLPLATIYNFSMVMIGLTVGWIVIIFHMNNVNRAATAMVQQQIIENGGISKGSSISKMIARAKTEIADSKTWMQRFFSLKSLHGILFFASWNNLAGRIFASNQSGDFTCHTYPVYKPIDTPKYQGEGENITLVPEDDPNYDNLPWNDMTTWVLMTIVGSLVIAAVFGIIYSYFSSRKAVNRAKSRNNRPTTVVIIE